MADRKPNDELTDKQLMFVGEYMLDLNGKQAAIRAGYSPATAESQASRLLSNAKVAAEVERRLERRGSRLEISAERIMAELARIAFSKGDDAVTFGPNGVKVKDSSELSADVLANISEVSETIGEGGSSTIRVKHHDKMRALDMLAKYYGLLKERVELTGAAGGPLEVETRVSLDSKLDGLAKRLGGDGSSEPG